MHDPNGIRVTSHEEFWVLSCRILGVQGPASPRHEPNFVLHHFCHALALARLKVK